MSEEPAPQQRDRVAVLEATTWADRTVYGVVVVLLLACLLLKPAVEALEPRIAVTRAFQSTNMGTPDDPWGRPFVVIRGPQLQEPIPTVHYFAYSCGPDGIDDHGEGDDLRPLDPDDWPLLLVSPGFSLALLALAVAAGGGWELLRVVRKQVDAPWAGVEREALRAAAVGLPAGALGVAVGWFLPRLFTSLAPLVTTAEKGLLVPFPVAIGGGVWLAVTLVVLWTRSRRVVG